MKKIFMILPSGEEIHCAGAPSLYVYISIKYEQKIVPLSGNKYYTVIHNLYDEEKRQFVTYKSV